MEDPGTFARVFEEEKHKVGLGDIFAGLYYHFLNPLQDRTTVVANMDVNADNTRYSPLGDGVWDITSGIQLRQLVSPTFYVFAVSDYTSHLEKNYVVPGNILSYGCGFGFITHNISMMEISLKAASIEETTIKNTIWFEKSRDLTFSYSWKSLYKGLSCYLAIGNLDEGLAWKTNNICYGLSFPHIWARGVHIMRHIYSMAITLATLILMLTSQKGLCWNTHQFSYPQSQFTDLYLSNSLYDFPTHRQLMAPLLSSPIATLSIADQIRQYELYAGFDAVHGAGNLHTLQFEASPFGL
jgi:hypothetical protein